jgi:hypothetical protein
MCSVHALITSAIARMCEDENIEQESLTFEAQKELRVYEKLSQLVPRLPERLMAATEEDVMVMAELVRLSPNSFGNLFIYKSFKRAYLLQGPTIPKV